MTGPAELPAGLTMPVRPGGQRIGWRRDPEAMHAFHVDVPAGATELELRFQSVAPIGGEQRRRVMTPDLFGLQWEEALRYPAGHYVQPITFEPSILLPAGWRYATALDGGRRTGDTVSCASVPLEKRVDSPLYAGRNFRRYELDTDPKAPVLWGSPTFAAGPVPGMTLLAVSGRAWSGDVLKEAVVAAKGGQGTIDLLAKNFDPFQTAKVAYRDGPRYPHLERIPGTPGRLADLLKPRT